VNRRRFLQFGLVGGALVATGSFVAFFRTRGYAIAPEQERSLVVLSVWQLVVAQHAARRIVASDDANDRAIPTADDTDVAGFIDAYVAKMPKGTRRDLLRFFAYLEHMAPLGLKLGSRFTRLSAIDQDRVLTSLETSDTPLLRAGFEGLKALIFMGYYRDPRTWRIANYAGPRVNRPPTGWW